MSINAFVSISPMVVGIVGTLIYENVLYFKEQPARG